MLQVLQSLLLIQSSSLNSHFHHFSWKTNELSRKLTFFNNIYFNYMCVLARIIRAPCTYIIGVHKKCNKSMSGHAYMCKLTMTAFFVPIVCMHCVLLTYDVICIVFLGFFLLHSTCLLLPSLSSTQTAFLEAAKSE